MLIVVIVGDGHSHGHCAQMIRDDRKRQAAEAETIDQQYASVRTGADRRNREEKSGK